MQGSPIQIGTINLENFEVPPSVRFGGRHRVIIHTLAGGARMLERLGPDDGDIQFRGTFSGPQAEARARAINNLRLTGETVWLTWESFRYMVVVRTFLADYYSPWWISYQLTCVIAFQAGAVESQSPTIDTLIAADLAAALAAVADTSIQLGSLQAVLASSNASTAGTADQSQAFAAVASSQAAIDQQMALQTAALINPPATGITVSGYGQSMQGTVASAGLLAAAANARGYVGRIGARLKSQGG